MLFMWKARLTHILHTHCPVIIFRSPRLFFFHFSLLLAVPFSFTLHHLISLLLSAFSNTNWNTLHWLYQFPICVHWTDMKILFALNRVALLKCERMSEREREGREGGDIWSILCDHRVCHWIIPNMDSNYHLWYDSLASLFFLLNLSLSCALLSHISRSRVFRSQSGPFASHNPPWLSYKSVFSNTNSNYCTKSEASKKRLFCCSNFCIFYTITRAQQARY